MSTFDPNAAASAGSGIFGLPCREEQSEVVIVPVPFAATTSYGNGAERGPAAVLAASHQVDLYDLQFGRVYERGIYLREPDGEIAAAHERAKRACRQLGAGQGEAAALRAVVDSAGELVNGKLRAEVEALFARRAVPAVLGGDHSVSFGAIAAAADRHPGLGILHVDAHADLRVAYGGLRWSHASIMHNVLSELADVERLVQVGVRDFCEQEFEAIQGSAGRVVTHFDQEWQRRRFAGASFAALCAEAVDALPEAVWISFDVDGLDPGLCPHTGTPVPSGLAFAEAAFLLEATAASGRAIVGFDLVEVAPGPGGDEWDANVGARLLYKLCGAALRTVRA